MRCSKKYIKFIFEDESANGIHLYTLSRAKSNGSINFVLSLKLEEEKHFPWTPQNPYIFNATSFLYIVLKI